MTPQAVMDSLKRTKPVCVVCHGASKHEPIVGDGTPVCYACILSLGRIAADPMGADPDRLVELSIAHEDVIELKPCEKHGGCWAWIGWAA
jgi:hypothetical protein